MFRLFALLALCMALCSHLNAATDYTPLSASDLQKYYDQLNKQLELSEKHLQQLVDEMANPKMMSPSLRIELQVAIDQNEAKKTLFQNFVDTPSMRSPAVRQRLLEILSSNEIKERDLLGLQQLVDSERKNIQDFDRRQVRPTPKPTKVRETRLKPVPSK